MDSPSLGKNYSDGSEYQHILLLLLETDNSSFYCVHLSRLQETVLSLRNVVLFELAIT
jgi:hypothetical protein